MRSEENAQSGISPELTQLVKESVCATFASMSGGEVSYLASSSDDAPCDGLVSIVSFVGDLGWSFMLGLPRQTALDLTLAFMGMELEFESADMADAVGELANILAGDFVARLEETKVKTSMSLPTVARGHDVELLLPHDVPTQLLAFISPPGSFWVKIAMARPGGGVVCMPGTERRDGSLETHLTSTVCWACGK